MGEYDVLNRLDAEQDWHRARRKVLYQEVVCFFKDCYVDLLSFEKVRTTLHLGQKIDRGLQEIPVDCIRGSVGRYDDFTSAFLPRKKCMEKRFWKRSARLARRSCARSFPHVLTAMAISWI